MSRDEALTLALEALEWNMAYLPTSHDDDGTTMAIEAVAAIKEALAQTEKQKSETLHIEKLDKWLDASLKERKEALAQLEQEIDWKDMYEKEKRRSAMWLAKYEAVAGPAPKAYPQSQPEQQESLEDLHNALHRIDTAAVGLPTFAVRHEGGLDAVVQNIVDAIVALHEQPAQPEQEQTGIREIRVTETVKQEQESVGEVNRHGRDSHGRQWHSIHWYDANVDVPHGTKLYTASPKSEQEPVLQDIEQYRMQMAGISTAAIGYWKEGDSIHPDYDTLALRDVAKLYSKYDALYKARWPAQPEQEPIVCCGDYATCMKSCTPRGRWLAEQEPVADRLVRQYINSLVANKPDEAANATKAMVDYVYTSPPAQPKQEPVA